jgi:GTP-binding protein
MPAIFLKSAMTVADLPEGKKAQIAMLGRSNVGKSTFINSLIGAKLARTSCAPGLTQCINLFEVDKRYHLVDLPGYGYARGSAEKRKVFAAMLCSYLSEAKNLKLVVLIIDARVGFTELDEHALTQLKENGLPHLVVVNKTDKLSRSELNVFMSKIRAAHPGVPFMPHNHKEVKVSGEIREAIEKAVRMG